MAERPNALVLKTSDGKPSGGSNPPASAENPIPTCRDWVNEAPWVGCDAAFLEAPFSSGLSTVGTVEQSLKVYLRLWGCERGCMTNLIKSLYIGVKLYIRNAQGV